MYVGLKQPRGDGERYVTPARAAAKETNMAATPSASSVASISSAFYECSLCHGLAPDLGT